MNKKRKLSRIGKILIVFLAVFALAGGAAAAGTVTREHVHADPALPGGHGANGNQEPETYTITTTADPASGGNVTGYGTYLESENVTVIATPTDGYAFVQWEENGAAVSTDASYTFKASADRDLTAKFAETYPVTFECDPAAGGNITITNVSATTQGTERFAEGEQVELSITANNSYLFKKLTVNGTNCQTRTDLMTGERTASFPMPGGPVTVKAEFSQIGTTPNTRTLNVYADPIEGGTVTGGGTFIILGNVPVTATANSGYVFDGWYNGTTKVSDLPYYKVRLNESVTTLTAKFVQGYTVNVQADPDAGGTVGGGGTHKANANATVTATPNEGYEFKQWEENGSAVSTDASYAFTVQENRTLTAVFEKKAKVTYKIVNGTWADDSTGEKVVWIKKGQENTDIPTGMKAPNTYCNGSWDNDPEGAVITGDTTYTYTYTDRRKPTAVILKSDSNVTIAANGRHNVDYHVVRTDNNNIVYAGYSDVLMNGSKDGQKVLVAGDEIGVLIGGKGGPNGDENDKTYDTIARYSIFGSKLGIGQHTVEFSFPGNNYYAPSSAVVQVTVTDGMQYNVNLTAEPSAGGTVTGGGTYNANENVTVTATPNEGYEFKQWEENGTVVSTDASYTFTAQENRTMTAVFEETAYTVTLNCEGYGTATLSVNEAKKGDTVKVTPFVREGSELYSAKVVGAGGQDVKVKAIIPLDGSDSYFTFTMPDDDVTVQLVFRGLNWPIHVTKTGETHFNIDVPSTAAGYEKVTVEPTLMMKFMGAIIRSVTAKSNDGTDIPVTKDGDSFTFTMPDQPVYLTVDIGYPPHYLKDITASGGTLTPAFEPEVTDYSITVPYATQEIGLTAEDTDSLNIYENEWRQDSLQLTYNPNYPTEIIKAEGKITLDVGDKVVHLKSNKVNGLATKSEYTVTITRLPPPVPVIEPASLTKIYNGEETALSVKNASDYQEWNPVYQWYKDGSEIEGATGSTYTVKDVSDSGVYTVAVTVTTNGKPVTVTSEETEVTIKEKIPTQIEVRTIGDTEVNRPFTIEATLTDKDGNPLSGKQLFITVNGTALGNISDTDEQGKVTASYTPDDNTDLVIAAAYMSSPGDMYNGSTGQVIVNVTESGSVLTLQAEKDTYTYGENVTVSGTLTDANGEKIVNEEIKLSVNGTDLVPASPVKTDADGKYTYTIISRPDAGNCTVKAAFEGVAGSIRGSTAETEVNIYKRPVKIMADDKICTDLDAADPLTWTMEDEADNWFALKMADILLTVTDGDGNTVDPETAEPGRYTVTPSWKTENTNYDATFVSGVVDTTHDWGDWTQTKDPTVDEEGVETRVCSRDPSHIETRPVPRLPVTLTFNIVNGTWDDGSVTTTARAVKGTILTAGDVPASVPDSGYGVGEWDVDPVGAEVEGEATFTYTYKHYNISYNTGSIGTAPGDETSYWHSTYGVEVLGYPAYIKPAESGDDAYTFDIYNPWYDNPEFNGDPVEYMTEVVRDMILYTKWIGPKKVIESASVNVTASKGDAIPDGQMIDPADLADFYLESPAGADYHIGWVMWENPDGDAAFVPGKTYTVMFALGTSTGENEYSGFFKGHQSAKTGEYTWDVSKAYALTVNGEGANDSIQDVGAYSSMVRYEYTVPEHGLEHVAAKAETCTEDGNTEYWVCTRGSHPCGKYFSDAAGKNEISKEETVVKAKGHDPGDAVKENEKAADCETDGSYDEVVYCKTCKKELTRKTVKVDATGHKWGKWTVSKPATCTEKGEEQAVCEHDSSHVDTREIAATGHDPGDAVKENEKAADCETDGSYDEVVYCKTCKNELSRKQVIVKATGHAWGEWTVTKEPTETEDGVKTKVCSHNPKHIETQGIPATGHVHDLEKIAKKDAGCTTSGMKEHYKCKKCGLLYTDANGSVQISEEALVIPPAGHTEGEKTKRVVKDATCEEAGSYYEEIHCTVCGELLKDELKTEPALDHDWDEWKETKAATCTSAGEEKRICKRNGSHTETKEIPATGHDWGEWKVTKAATETEEGIEERTCKNDSEHKETRSIPLTGHVHDLSKVDAQEADCDSEGNTEYWICDQGDNPCGHIFADEAGKTEINIEDTVVKATEHNAKDAVKENEIAATCETEGSYDDVIYCEHCNKELSRETKKIKATGHDWDEGVVTTEATCNGKGEKTFTCKHDKLHTRTEEIPAIGHKWGEWTVTKPATCTEKGEEQRVCEHDKSHVEKRDVAATDHDWGEWKLTREATETEKGEETRICKNNSEHKETRETDVIAHVHEPGDAVHENEKAADCENDGSYDEVVCCKKCKTEISRKQVTVKATGHDWGEWTVTKEPTETEDGVKTCVCKHDSKHVQTIVIPATGHVHDLEKIAKKDAGCTTPGMKEHYKCKKCGLLYTDSNGSVQISEEALVIPPAGHTEGEKTKRVVKDATCEEAGSYYEEIHCTVCGELLKEELTSESALGHDWDEWKETKAATCTSAGEEKRICKRDNSHTEVKEIPATGHDWGEWKVTKAATETEEGTEERTCKNDPEHKETRSIPVTGHVHELSKVDAQEADCDSEGNTEYWICDQGDNPCGHIFADEEGKTQINPEDIVIKTTDHKGGPAVKEKEIPATCETEGSYVEVICCEHCGEELSRELKTIPATGHDWDEGIITTEPTCNGKGEKTFTCKHDKLHTRTEEIAATGHDWGEWKVTKQATETETGEETRVCKNNAEHKETRVIDAIGHVHEPGDAVHENEKAADCENDGSFDEVVYCKKCNEELSRNRVTVKATGHDWGDWTVTKEPTETEDGVKTCVCKHNNDHVQTIVIPATGHVHDLEKIARKDAGCTTPGMEEHYKCKKCGLLYTDVKGSVQISEEALVIPPAGHTEGENTKRVVKAATCEEAGSYYEEVRCFACGELLKEKLMTEPALDHDWDAWKETRAATCTSVGEEKRVCKHDKSHTEVKVIPATGHDWGEWKVTKAATETEEGTEERTCKNDPEHKETRSIPVIGHVHELSKVDAQEADCDSEGNTEYWICDQGDNPCGHIFADEEGKTQINPEYTVIKTTEHKGGPAIKEKEIPATCETEGSYVEVIYCEHCGEELSREVKTIPATGHDWDDGVITTEATCNGKGEKTFTCKHDKLHTRTEEIPATGHDWGEWKVTKEATETENGEETRVCKNNAEHKETRVINAIGHVHEPGDAVHENEKATDCESDGSYDEVVYCKTCKTELSRKQVTVKAPGHDWGVWTVTKAATETEDGIETRTCKNDQEHKETRKIPAANHVHDLEKIAGKEPGCTASGLKEHYKCKKCGLLYTDSNGSVQINEEALVIPPAGHTEGEKTKRVVTEATCEEAGSYYDEIHCTVCGELLKEELMSEPALGHDWDEWKETKAATCTTAGEEKRICKRDNSHAEVKDISTKGHDWGEWKVTKAATETEDGTEERICKNDPEHKESRIIPAKGQTPGPGDNEEKKIYNCIYGNGNIWTKGSGVNSEFTFTRIEDDENTFDHYTELYADGRKLTDAEAVVRRGSLKVSLLPEFLETLAVGDHILKAEFDDGSAEAGFTILAKADPGQETDDDPDGGKEKDDPGKQDEDGEKDDPGKQGNSEEQSGTDSNDNNDNKDKEKAENNNNDNNDPGVIKNEASDKNTNVTGDKTLTVRSSNAANTSSGSVVAATSGKAASSAAATGDTNNNFLWLLLLIISAAVLTGAVVVRRKKTKE